MTVKELIIALQKEDPTKNVFIPVEGESYCDGVTSVKNDIGYYENLIVLKSERS